jgi:hypothetical protein
MSSTKTPAILVENPKGENESWQQWGEKLAEKYKTPAATPNLPPVPGHDKLRTSFPILSSPLINPNNSISPCSRNLEGIRNSVGGLLQHRGCWQTYQHQGRSHPPCPPLHRGLR